MPFVREALEVLHANGIMCWAVSNGAISGTKGYLKGAGVAEFFYDGSEKEGRVLSCDDVKSAKPSKEIYQATMKSMDQKDETKSLQRWFLAAHSWDLCAARNHGFKTAWTAYEEVDSVPALFGENDVEGLNLLDAAKRIVEIVQAAEGK